jgi:hypothetical protein
MQKRFLYLILAAILMGCNLPTRGQPTATADPVSTQVSLLLTQMPTATGSPQPETPTPLSLPSDTPPQPTATSTPPSIPATLTATISPSDPKSSLGQPAYQNTFERSQGLYLYESENTRVFHENGALMLSGVTADGWHGWSLIYSHPSQHFYLEGTFRTQTCAGADLYGLVFRAEGSEAGYFFGATCDGRYNLHARDFTDGSDLRQIDLTANSAIQSGTNAVNRLGVMANGDRINLYANGVMLQEIIDSTFSEEGNFGAFVAANATPGFTVHLDEISLWDLPGY